MLLALVALMALLSDSFLTSTNVTNILRQVTIVGLVAIGMAVVLIGGNFDLRPWRRVRSPRWCRSSCSRRHR